MRMRRKDADKVEVMRSPLIDAVFLLLIFFLVATMYKKQDRDIDITPPESASAVKLPPEDETLVLGMDEKGGLFWQGVGSTANEFHERMKQVALTDPQRHIRLDADHETPFWRVVEVLNMCQFRGLRNVGIRTYDDRYNTK